jgi:predicted DNA-binding ribbon-helix-helix protein
MGIFGIISFARTKESNMDKVWFGTRERLLNFWKFLRMYCIQYVKLLNVPVPEPVPALVLALTEIANKKAAYVKHSQFTRWTIS